MKAIRLLQTCIIAGLPRSPVEGIQTVTDDEADRFIAAGMAEDAGDDLEAEIDDGLDKMTVPQLRELAGKEEVQLEDNAKKADIIDAIRGKRLDAPQA